MLCFVFWCRLLWHPCGAQFSKQQVLRDNFWQQGSGNLWGMIPEFRNCAATILHNASPHKLHKVVRNDGWPPTALLIMHMLSTSCKLSVPATHHLLAHYFRPGTTDHEFRLELCSVRSKTLSQSALHSRWELE